MTTEGVVLLPVLHPFPNRPELVAIQQAGLDELVALSGRLAPSSQHFGNSAFHFKLLEGVDEEAFWHRLRQSRHLRKYSYLEVRIDCASVLAMKKQQGNPFEDELSPSQLEYVLYDQAFVELQFELNCLLLAINIALPGVLSVWNGLGYIGERFISVTDQALTEHLYGAVVESQARNGWPPTQHVGVEAAWLWLRRSEALKDGVGIGSLGRTLAALSHLIGPRGLTDNPATIAWALLGLEALYTDGSSSILTQLLRKSEILLGAASKNKNSFRNVYKWRSKFLHGDLDIPLRFTPFDAAAKYEQHFLPNWHHTDMAIAVLMATLQWMVVNNRVSLEFDYQLRPSNA